MVDFVQKGYRNDNVFASSGSRLGVLRQYAVFFSLITCHRKVLFKECGRISLMFVQVWSVEMSRVQIVPMPLDGSGIPVVSGRPSSKLGYSSGHRRWCRRKASITRVPDMLQGSLCLLIIEDS